MPPSLQLQLLLFFSSSTSTDINTQDNFGLMADTTSTFDLFSDTTTSTGTIVESGRQISRGTKISRGTARPLLLLLLTTMAPIGTAAAHFSGGITTVGRKTLRPFL